MSLACPFNNLPSWDSGHDNSLNIAEILLDLLHVLVVKTSVALSWKCIL